MADETPFEELTFTATDHTHKRAAGDHFGDWFNVLGFGAVGNNSTDDRDAIQAAYDACHAAGGGTVYFPIPRSGVAGPGYKVLSSIMFDEDDEIGVRFLGEIDGTRIVGTVDGYVFDRRLATPNNTRAQRIFERMFITNSHPNGGCIRIGSSIGAVIRNCHIGGHIGVTTEDEPGVSSENTQIQDCLFAGDGNYVGAAGIIIGGGGSITGTDVRGQNNSVIAYGSGLFIGGCRSERASVALRLGLDSAGNNAGMYGLSVSGETFEGNWTAIDFVGTCSGVSLNGILIQGHDSDNAGPVGGNDQYCKSLLSFDGTDASTTITADNAVGSATTHTWTAAGNAQIDTADKAPLGTANTASLLLDGTGDWVTTNDHADFTLGSSDFAVDFWFKCTATGGAIRDLCGQQNSSATNTTRSFRIRRNASNVIEATVTVGTTDSTLTGTTQFTDALNTGWHHVVLSRASTTLRLYVDGVAEDTDTIAGTVNDSSNALRIGAAGEVTTNTWMGWIDEWRLSVGVPRYTWDFGVPAAPRAQGTFTGADSPASKGQEWGIRIRANSLSNAFINGVSISNWHDEACVEIENSTARANVLMTGVVALHSVGRGVAARLPTTAHTVRFLNCSMAPVYTYSGLPTSPIEGDEYNISDSTTAAWGANVTTGGGLNNVLVRWNGSNWTVVGA